MIECLPQTFLRNGGTLSDLLLKYAIKVARHRDIPHLVQLKYHQIESPMGEPIVQQCRGLILDESNNWEIVAWPFNKFFNHGEGHAAKIDWGSAVVQEKLDGSLYILYCYRDKWMVGTSGTPDGSGQVNGLKFTFDELFWRVFDEVGGRLRISPQRTYMLELMTPWNRVVVQHAKNRLALIGCRNLSGEEIASADSHAELEIAPVPQMALQSFDEIMATFDAMSPLQQEGYVVVDRHFNRVKVKHPGYVALHHMRDGFGPRRIVEVIRSGESSEVLTAFPEWTEPFNKVREKYDALVTEAEAVYLVHKDIEVQKDFAMLVKDLPYAAVLFALRAKKVTTAREFIAKMSIDGAMRMLGVEDIEFAPIIG